MRIRPAGALVLKMLNQGAILRVSEDGAYWLTWAKPINNPHLKPGQVGGGWEMVRVRVRQGTVRALEQAGLVCFDWASGRLLATEKR